jgi:hypothetical protein
MVFLDLGTTAVVLSALLTVVRGQNSSYYTQYGGSPPVYPSRT